MRSSIRVCLYQKQQFIAAYTESATIRQKMKLKRKRMPNLSDFLFLKNLVRQTFFWKSMPLQDSTPAFILKAAWKVFSQHLLQEFSLLDSPLLCLVTRCAIVSFLEPFVLS